MRHHVSFLTRKQKIVCIGVNNYNKPHPARRFGAYVATSKFVHSYVPSLHSECSLAIRTGLEDWSGFSLFNIRIDNNGDAAMSRCCVNCQRVVKALGPDKIFYSVDNERFDRLDI